MVAPPSARRAIGVALVGSGAFLLVAAGVEQARSSLARDAARARWAELEAHGAVSQARRSVASADAPTRAGAPLARLVIPTVSLDEVVVEGIGPNELRAGPGHLPGTVFPGATGNSVVSAHRDRHFRPLAGVRVGDEIRTYTLAGETRWQVTAVRVVDADAKALVETDVPTLTLTTCWPIRFFGPAPQRLIVTAGKVGVARSAKS